MSHEGEQMPNERLRSALLARGMTVQSLADEIEVNPKTVERWITQGKVPYRRHQYATAAALKVDVTTLWDDSRVQDSVADQLLFKKYCLHIMVFITSVLLFSGTYSSQ